MKTNFLLYHIINLVSEGHKLQDTNLNGVKKSSWLWFSPLQLLALLLAVAFLFVQPEGLLYDNIIDYVLSSLSILTGIYLSLIVFIYDRYKALRLKELEEFKRIRTWNFYNQLTTLTSYSILIAILVIMILISTLLFGEKTNLNDYALTSDISISSAMLFLKLALIVITRVSFIYFLLDFFILCVYIVSGIFDFISDDMNESKPEMTLNRSKSALHVLWDKNKRAVIISWSVIIIMLAMIFAYIYTRIRL